MLLSFGFLVHSLGIITEPISWAFCKDWMVYCLTDLLYVLDALLHICHIKRPLTHGRCRMNDSFQNASKVQSRSISATFQILKSTYAKLVDSE